jgi:hypothetical protein
MLHDNATYTMAELSQLIVNYFELGNNVADTLCFCYTTHLGEERKIIIILIIIITKNLTRLT